MIADLLLDPDRHPIVGHRGASGLAPENTLASFDLAREQGAEAFELDVRLSGDGIAVVCHDPTVDRTTASTGPVGARTAAALAALDAGARFTTDAGGTFPFRDRQVGIPTFAQVLDRYRDIPLLVELKEVAAGPAVQSDIRRAGAEGRVVVASFLDAALVPFRATPFLAGASRRDIVALVGRSYLGWPRTDRAVLYAVPVRYKDRIPVPTRRFVAAARRLGRPVHVWTVDEPAVADRLWELGAAGMITNYPARLLQARNRRFG